MILLRARFRTLLLVPVALVLLFPLTSSTARSATTPRIVLNPKFGPPGVPFTVRGAGFGAEVTVTISFDRTFLTSVVTSPDGTFTTTVTPFPRTETPGKHLVVAAAPPDRVQAPHVVRTDWSRYHFDNANTGLNPYENVLSAENVGALVQRWAVPFGGGAAPDPIVAYGKVYVAPTDGIV